MEKKTGTLYMINGPVVKARKTTGFMMHEVVRVGKLGLIGEIISLDGDEATIQIYEETTGLKAGEPVIGSGKLLSVALGPGLIGNVYDGIQRPLEVLRSKSSDFLKRGIEVSPIDFKHEWDVNILVREGDTVKPGQIAAEIQETSSFTHRVIVPPDISGTVNNIRTSGRYTADTVIAEVNNGKKKYNLQMFQNWPVRTPRPYKERLAADEPLITGQRVIDTFFPLNKGGSACIPGGFGAGKTVLQHQFAKWSDADVIVYIGCGERGNEMTEVLEEFPELKDPRNGKPLMDRTILIANTSNMPVSAREASIYTGVTIAEYFRDMGYHVALMADSTSRWAEALREISGRLEEMPAEEGFPPYLSSRLAEFYERAGKVIALGNESVGSVSIIGAVSPPGGDFSEPVTTHTKRFTRCFWALDKALANARHYPSVNWLTSYSESIDDVKTWYSKNVNPDFFKMRDEALALLNEDDRLQQIIKLVGEDVLPDDQKLIVRAANLVKVGFLQQNSYSKVDAFSSLSKQYEMLKIMLLFYTRAKGLISSGVAVSEVLKGDIVNKLMRIKEEVPNEEMEKMKNIETEMDNFFNELDKKYIKQKAVK
ncbi:MAG: V-type ATP synthase subunit A [Spirochaetales bacterium]|nr:V-type ATP synthase subunit A [Spirochaetales bacterium]